MKRLRNGVFATGNARAGRVASRHGRWRPSIAPYRDGTWAVRGMACAPPVRHGVRPVPGALGVPDAAPCAGREPRQAVGGARRRPCKTLSVCYLPSPRNITHAWCARRRDGRPPGLPARALPPLPRALCTQNSHAWGTCIARATRWSPVRAPHPCGAIIGCRASRLAPYRKAARKEHKGTQRPLR